MTSPHRPQPVIIPGTPAHRLIRGVLRVDAQPLYIEQIRLLRTPEWSLSIVDTGEGDDAPLSPDGDVTFHILWQRDEENASITAGNDRYPIAPGDSMSAPGGVPVKRSADMLLVQIETSSRTLQEVLPPSHGAEAFDGYNRRTNYNTPSAFSLERWKITQPLTIPASDSPYGIIDLASPLALTWSGGADLIGRGECRIVDPSIGPITLLPDGLGYALVVR